MKYLCILSALMLCSAAVSTDLNAAENSAAQTYSLHLVPGEHKGYNASAGDIAQNLPARLSNARLTVVVRPESGASEHMKAAVESALQARFRHISLLDRKNLDAVLSEQGRSMEDYVNVRTAPELQRVELAQAILFIDLQEVVFFPELISLVVTASVVDVETAVKVWQSPPLTYTTIWWGYPAGLIVVILVLMLPFHLAYRRACRKARETMLTDFNYTQLHPRLLATRERLDTIQRDLYQRQYKDEAREIHSLGEQVNYLTERAKILDTAVSAKGTTNSKKMLDTLDKTADRIDRMESIFTEISKNIRNNNVKNFDDKVNSLRGLTDEILSDFTHLEQMK
jgi:hypothetical protein